ncbi:MAG: WecB/TagA/CpsF family glycosyltransferase [Candidatus Omnitrophica bacterium]|nr:WecB/TagA/CpsF family glycosyltransferase [Candidatus Omnitrophota bacterium]
MYRQIRILGVKFDNLSLDECVFVVEDYLHQGGFHFIAAPDMSRVVKALRDPYIKNIYNNADLTLSDGTAVILVSRVLGLPLKERVPCSDLAEKLLVLSQKKGYRVFLLKGGDASEIERVIENLLYKYPGINITGISVPYDFNPYDEDMNNRIINEISRARPQILMFSLGCPKEEHWVWSQRDKLRGVSVCIGIGGTMDIFAGKRKLAPRWMREKGLEWLFRIMQEPQRLSRRYLVSSLFFFYFIFRQILKNIFSLRHIIHRASSRFRDKRFAFFKSLTESLPKPIRILDVGGTPSFWQRLRTSQKDMEIYILNCHKEVIRNPYFKGIVGDARDMRQFRNGEFDIVFSNSVIEHLGDFDSQRRMANEIRRVGKHYFLQTPNRYFPLEPHFLFPFFQFLPYRFKNWLVTNFNLGWHGRIATKEEARREINSIRMLDEKELRELFPEAEIVKEKFLGLTKSFIVYSI